MLELDKMEVNSQNCEDYQIEFVLVEPESVHVQDKKN